MNFTEMVEIRKKIGYTFIKRCGLVTGRGLNDDEGEIK